MDFSCLFLPVLGSNNSFLCNFMLAFPGFLLYKQQQNKEYITNLAGIFLISIKQPLINENNELTSKHSNFSHLQTHLHTQTLHGNFS